MSGLQLRRGASGNLTTIVASTGEPLFDTTNNALYVSDGSTPRFIGSPRRQEYAYAEFTQTSITTASYVTLGIDTATAVVSSSDYFVTNAASGIQCVRGGTYKLTASLTALASNAPKTVIVSFCEGGTETGPSSYLTPGRNKHSDTASITLIKSIAAGTYISVCGKADATLGNSEIPNDHSSIAIELLEDA